MVVKSLTATEASRHFAEVLDAVEHDRETFVVTRGGRPVAAIAPAERSGGRALKTVLRRYRADTQWAGELRALRDSLRAEDRVWRD